MKKFSIILPVKNGGEYVKECIHSMLKQTLNDFDIIILDNSSTDGTVEWLKSLCDDRIIIYEADKPLSIEENWSRAVAIPKNQFMTLIGHDDILEPAFLEEMNSLINAHPQATLFTSQFDYIDSTGKSFRAGQTVRPIENGPEFLSTLLQNKVDIMGTGFVMRSTDYQKVGGIPAYPNLLFADFTLWFSLTSLGYKVASDKKLFSFRVHQSTTTISSNLKFQQAFEKLVFFLATLKNDERYNNVLQNYAIEFIKFYCKGLSHRLLKTALDKREGLTVKSFLVKCKGYADLLVPVNNFNPESDFSVRTAKWLDSSNFTRRLFLSFKKIRSKPLMK